MRFEISATWWYFGPNDPKERGMLEDLDMFDRKILRAVQKNGRLSINDLSETVGLSKTPCLTRLRRLENKGYIQRYKGVLDASKIRQDYVTFVQVKLTSTTRRHLKAFSDAVQSVPQIESCHMMSGGYDFLLKIRTRNMRRYRELLGDVLSELPGIAQTSTFPVMETVKDTDDLVVVELEE
jgi:Lrp/AsnC family transcriptional regulator, leucine-responsive regulatory protein